MSELTLDQLIEKIAECFDVSPQGYQGWTTDFDADKCKKLLQTWHESQLPKPSVDVKELVSRIEFLLTDIEPGEKPTEGDRVQVAFLIQQFVEAQKPVVSEFIWQTAQAIITMLEEKGYCARITGDICALISARDQALREAWERENGLKWHWEDRHLMVGGVNVAHATDNGDGTWSAWRSDGTCLVHNSLKPAEARAHCEQAGDEFIASLTAPPTKGEEKT